MIYDKDLPKKSNKILISDAYSTVKKTFLIFLAISISTVPVLAWDFGGDSDCPYSNSKENKEKTEQIEESDQ